MEIELDCREETCPVPFVEMKIALKNLVAGQKLNLIVSDKASIKDISRFLTNKGFRFELLNINHQVYQFIILGR